MNKLREAYIIDGIRSPVGRHTGSLAYVRTDDLAALAINNIIKRNSSIPPEAFDDVYFGCANQAGEDNRNVARMALLLAGLPTNVPGITVNRLCASGMSAVIEAARAVQTNDGNVFIAGGVENMTRAPYVMSKPDTAFGGKPDIYDTSIGWRFPNPRMKEIYGIDSMGDTAENLAELYKISREEQDEFAYCSQMKASAAQKNGRLQKEIFPVEINRKKEDFIFEKDEFIKPSTTREILLSLKPSFRKDGTVTAGNSSGINDGSCALIVASEDAVKKYNLKPRARIIASAVAGVEPRIMGIGPVYAVNKLLNKLSLKIKDFDIIELNEAFAAQCIAVLRDLSIDANDPRLNPNGGAIALGHPLGMSGARLITTAMIELEEKNKQLALCTMCVGVGQGMAVVIEKV